MVQAKKTGKNSKKPENKKSVTVKKIKGLHKRTASFLLIESILFGLAALFIFVKPVEILTSLAFIFGLVLTVIGLYQSITGIFIKDKNTAGRNLTIAFGIVNVILGLLFLLQPSGALYAIVYAFAILFFVKSIKSLIFSIKLYKEKIGNYVIDIVISGVMLFLSSLILFFPELGLITFMYYIGIMFSVYAIADAHMYMEFLKLKEKHEK